MESASFTSLLDDASIAVLCEVLDIRPTDFPPLEDDREAVQFLADIARHIDTQTQIARAETEHYTQLKRHYQLEERRIQEQLRLIGISTDALSNEGQGCVDFIVRVSEALQLRQPKLNHIASKWTQTYLQKRTVDEKKTAVERVIDRSLKMKERVERTRNKVETEIEEVLKKKRTSDLVLPTDSETKIKQYRNDTVQYRAVLEKRGYRTEISHKAVVQTAEQLKSLRMKTASIKKELAEYDPELPRNMEGARNMLATIEKEFGEVSERIRLKITD